MDIDDYPRFEVSESVSSYFGTSVYDPFRGLETDSKERQAWLESQQRLTDSYLAGTGYQSFVEDVVTESLDYRRLSTPQISDDYLYYFLNQGLEDHSALYRSPPDGDVIEDKEVFIRPALFDGDNASITSYDVSDSGKYVAVLISRDGQDWQRLHVFDAQNGEEVIDPIDNVKFSGLSWIADEQVLFSVYPSSDNHTSTADSHELRACNVETEDTRSLFGDSEEYQFVRGFVSDDDAFIVVLAAQTTGGDAVYVKRVGDKSFTEYVAEEDFEFKFLGHVDEEVLFQTNYDAPNKRVVSIPHDDPWRSAWTTVVEEHDRPMEVSSAGGYLFARILEDARHTVTQYDYRGSHVADVSLPGRGHVHGFSGSRTDDIVYFTYTDHLTPPTVLRYDMNGGGEEVFEPSVALDTDDYVSYQVFYTSKDGTEIPMTITHREDVERDGENPVMMFGYGGFGISLTPTFTASKAAWLQLGGVYAEPTCGAAGNTASHGTNKGRRCRRKTCSMTSSQPLNISSTRSIRDQSYWL